MAVQQAGKLHPRIGVRPEKQGSYVGSSRNGHQPGVKNRGFAAAGRTGEKQEALSAQFLPQFADQPVAAKKVSRMTLIEVLKPSIRARSQA